MAEADSTVIFCGTPSPYRKPTRGRSGPDITQRKFVRLTALYQTRISRTGSSMWLCRCVCGTEKEVTRSSLLSGHIRSCGCLNREVTAERNRQSRKYQLDENAFRTRSPQMAYWLGFIIADGCLYYGSIEKPKSPRLLISLSVKDTGHLSKLNAFLKSNTPIRTVAPAASYGGPVETIVYYGGELCESLRLLGIEPRKSGREVIPHGYEDDPDLWRGLVDGDGWLFHGQRQGEGPRATIGLCGSRVLCEAFAAFVARRVGGTVPLVRPDKSIWKTVVSGKRVAELVRVLYSGACYSLDRKAAIASEIMGIEWPSHEVPICTVCGCGREARGCGFCFAHWKRFRNYGSALVRLKNRTRLPPRKCSEPGCERQHYSRGFCRLHWERLRKVEKAKSIEN